MIRRPLNRLGQLLFGINDRRAMKDLARKDSIAIYYRGMYVAARIDSPPSFSKDKEIINQELVALGFKGIKVKGLRP